MANLMLDGITAIAAAAAAVFFFVASMLQVRDSSPQCIADMQAIAWWNGMGSASASAVALLVFVMWLKQWGAG
jgi:hypothetical protein